MTESTYTLKADAAGFLIGGQPIKPSRSERALLERLRDDVHAIRQWLEAKGSKPGSNKRAANDPARDLGGSGARAAARPATPRLSTAGALGRTVAPRDVERPGSTSGTARPILVKVALPLSRTKAAGSDRQAIDRTLPMRDASGRYVAQPKIATPVLGKRAQSEAVPSGLDDRGRFTKDGEADPTGGKMRKLLGDIRDKISGPGLGGSEDVDPNIKAAQEIAGVAGGALRGVKAVGGVLGAVATPLGFMGRGKPSDAPTPWFRRFYNELRGLRREESVFNRAQLRTLKEIEAKPGQGKGGGLLGMLMMVLGPLIAAIGAALTAGFGLLMKLPGMGLLAKLATGMMPAALMPKRPITQPTTAPGVPGAPAGQPGQKKPSLWERTKSKVSGWMGKGTPESAPTVPVQEIHGPPKPPGRLAKAANAVKRVGKALPVLGRLMTLFSVASDVAAAEGDESLSRGEKDKRTGSAVGGGVGGIVGGVLGTMLGGPIGGLVGSMIGDKVGAIVGEKFGGWVTELRNADIPGKLMAGWDKFTEGFSAVLKKLGLSGVADKAKETYSAAKDKVVQGATAAVDYGKEKAGQAGETLKNSAMGRGAGAIAGVIQSIGETRVFQREDGGIEKRDGGTRAWRNNNPGNMEYNAYTKSQGAVGTDGRFAVFPSYEAGAKAKENLIFGGKNYKDKSLTEAIARYAPPNENNTGRYQAAILASVGGQNKRMADYTPDERKAILAAMEKQEGFKVGKALVTGGAAMTATNATPATPSAPASTTVVTAGARAIPQMPSFAVDPPKVPDFQAVTSGLAKTLLGGEDKRQSVVVVGNKAPVGRDLSNRPLAHIVTGGLSGKS